MVAIVLAAAWRIGSRTLRNVWLVGIAVTAFVSIALLHLPFPLIVIAAAILGLVGGRILPGKFGTPGGRTDKTASAFAPSLIDDDTPTPAHARFSWAKLVIVTLTGIAVGALVWTMVAIQLGTSHPFAQMGRFFTKAAMLTFGGAYAVLPYVYQAAVEHYQSATATQMIDGLGLGETTPGPLIMIVAFVGFIGGWTKQVFGADSLLIAGVTGACIATFFTFLPSFLFILAGGPLAESTRDDIRLTAPLIAVSAAVVGVIASLAVFFSEHVYSILQDRCWNGIL